MNEDPVGAVTDTNAADDTSAEDAAAGTLVGITALATDPDVTDTVSYSVDDARFTIDGAGVVRVAAGASFDAETEGSINLTVTATSTDGSTSSEVFAVNVTDVDEFDIGPVTDIDAADNTIAEDATDGTIVGITALADDPDGDLITHKTDQRLHRRLGLVHQDQQLQRGGAPLGLVVEAVQHPRPLRADDDRGVAAFLERAREARRDLLGGDESP